MAHFDSLVLKDYPLWTLYLHSNQYYLGRAYAWLKRAGTMQRFSQLTSTEIRELHGRVLPAYERALEYLWHPEHLNYAWLGNEFTQHGGHGHLHIVPRYERPVRFANARFIDERWEKNYAPYPKQEYDDELLCTIRDALRAALSSR